MTPPAPSVPLGGTQPFQAMVHGSNDTSVIWQVNGNTPGTLMTGTVDANGVYTAPRAMPSPPKVRVTAVSHADGSSSGSADVTITSDVAVTVQPSAASVNLGAARQFMAQVTGSGNPLNTVAWSLSGPGCTGAACGQITAGGLYTAPQTLPSPPMVVVTATSDADPSKMNTASVTVTSNFSLMVSPSNATVALEQTQQFTAMVSGLPSQAVQWYVNNLLGGDPGTVGTITNNASTSGLYTAPVNMVAGRQVTITATSTMNSAVTGSVTLLLTSNIVVQVAPPAASRIIGARQTFSATVMNTSNPNVGWTVNDVPNGNAAFGEICVAGSAPCQPPPLSVAPGSVEYQAPAAVPTPAMVTVKAVSVADPAQFGSATVTILSQVMVSLSPPSATVPPTGAQEFLATVVGSADQNVTWDVNGFANGSVSLGVICLRGSNPCQAPAGAMAGPIEYRAPAAPPAPSNSVTVRATSELGGGIAQSAAVTVSTGPFIFSLLPASVTTSVTQPFGMRVQGVQFVAGGSGGGSTVMLGGLQKTTNCPSTTECDITVDAMDVASAGTIAVTVENPGAPPVASNSVNFVAVPPDNTEDIITLNTANPQANGKDIVVVEPTTAGTEPIVTLTLQGMGTFDSVKSVCALGPEVVTVTRPATGSVPFSLCLVGTNLTAVSSITFSEPTTPDITAGNLSIPAGTLVLAFMLTVPSSAQPGLRTVYASAVNSDRAALTGSLEIK